AGASVRFTGAVYGAHLSGIVTASAWRYLLTDATGAIYTPHGVYAAIEMDVTNPGANAEELSVNASFALRDPASGQIYPLVGDIYQESAVKNTFQKNNVYDAVPPDSATPMVFLFDIPAPTPNLQLASLSPW